MILIMNEFVLNEVYNKVGALLKALEKAEEI